MQLIRKGRIGELKAIIILLELGYDVYENTSDDNGVDLVAYKDGQYKAIQVKYATKLGRHHRVGFGLGTSDNKPDLYMCLFQDKCWLIPADEIGASKSFNIYPNSKKFLKYNRYQLLYSEGFEQC